VLPRLADLDCDDDAALDGNDERPACYFGRLFDIVSKAVSA
jgi:hypothetical protein